MARASSPAYRFGDALALARESWVRSMAEQLAQRGHPDYRRSDAAVTRRLRRGPLAIGELGDLMEVSRQAARKMATGLQRRGYARLERDAGDLRRITVTLTPAGQAYAEDVIDVINGLNRRLAEHADPADLCAAQRILGVVIGGAGGEGDRAHGRRGRRDPPVAPAAPSMGSRTSSCR